MQAFQPVPFPLMLSEKATIISSDAQGLQVQTQRRASCSGCSMKSGCGQYLLARDQDRLRLDTQAYDHDCRHALQPGDAVLVGLEERQFLILTALFYALPLAVLLASVLLAAFVGLSEGMMAVAALAGLMAGFLLSRQLVNSNRIQKQIRPQLQRMPDQEEVKV